MCLCVQQSELFFASKYGKCYISAPWCIFQIYPLSLCVLYDPQLWLSFMEKYPARWDGRAKCGQGSHYRPTLHVKWTKWSQASKQGHSDWIPPRPLPTQCPPYDGPRIYQPPSGPCKYPLPPSITLLPIYCEIPSGYLKPVFLVHWPSLLPGQQCMGRPQKGEKPKTCLKTKIQKSPPHPYRLYIT